MDYSEYIKKIKQLIVSNENDKAFKILFELIENFENTGELQKTLILKNADYNEVNKRLQNGLMRYADYLIVKANINHTVLAVLSEVEKMVQEKKLDSQELNLNSLPSSNENNFVFIFGTPNVGKTILLMSIVDFISKNSELQLNNPDLQLKTYYLLNNQIETTGLLPEYSEEGIQEIDMGIKNLVNGNITNLSFLKMSLERYTTRFGELSQQNIDYPKNINKYLNSSKLFLIVTSIDSIKTDSKYIEFFINLISQQSTDIKISLVINKWESQKLDNNIIEFVQENAPSLYYLLQSKMIARAKVFPFDIISESNDNDIYTRNIVTDLYQVFGFQKNENQFRSSFFKRLFRN